MTDKPTPTDAELKALLLDKLPASKHYIRPVIEKMVAAMQAAIDKWGQPAVAGDVDRADAVNLARNALTQYDCAITKKGVRVLAEAVLSMDSALRTEQPAPSGATEEVENLRKALVYVAFALHDTPQYMLAQGIALIDGDTVRVSRDGWTVEASVNPHRQPAPAGATPECLTCSDHGAVGNILTAEPCPDCTRLNTQPTDPISELNLPIVD